MKPLVLICLLLCACAIVMAQAPTSEHAQATAPPSAATLVATPVAPAPVSPTIMLGKPTSHLFRGARIYIAPIDGGYDIYLTAALQKKQVPVVVVIDRSKADFEIAGATDTEKAGWAKMFFIGTDHSNEQASIKIADVKTGEIVYGYNVNKHNSVRGKQSSSEACAKHIKENIEAVK
jgi:hypothetical protein